MREFVAMTQTSKGGTEAVIVKAYDKDDARVRLARKVYGTVLWVL